MNTALAAAGAALLCAASGTIAILAVRPDESTSNPRVEQRFDALLTRLEGLERASEEQARAMRLFDERMGVEALRRAERQSGALAAPHGAAPAEHGETRASEAAAAEAPAAASEGAVAFDFDGAIKRLQSDDLTESQWTEVWEQLKKAGKLDEAVAYFEELAKNAPFDPDAHVQLASAYLNKIFEAGAGPAAGKWAMKVDATCDKALELDPKHLDARFMKAVTLSHWPPALGKQGEAIRQFETLLAQQQGTELSPRQAQTYLLLGNLYQNIGQAEKARETWQAGANLFPNNEGLRGQLQVNAGR